MAASGRAASSSMVGGRVFRLTSGFVRRFGEGEPVDDVVDEIVTVAEAEAARLRWLEEHEPAFVEALGSALVG